jgi:plastocyanin
MKSPAILVALLVLSLSAAGCSGGKADIDALATESADVAPSATLQIRAKDLKFDKDTLVAPAAVEVTLTLDNQDGAVHNVAIYTGKDAKENLFRGELFAGKATREYRFQAPPAGVYYFRCDAHPEMDGVFITR